LKQGQALYHTVGCVACHEPQARPEAVPGIMPVDPKLEAFDRSLQSPASVPLGNLARKMTVPQLAAFLRDPLSVRPSGRMPSLNLSEGEAKAIAVYLLRGQAAGLTDPSKRSLVGGLQYNYYEENFSGAPDFESFTPKSSGTVENFDLKPRKRDNNFGLRFSGNIQIPRDGAYTFYTRSDDGSMLYIDGKVVVDNNGDHAPQEKRGSADLTAGDHSIVVTFYNNGAGYELAVSWRGPGFGKQAIPAAALSHFGQPMLPIDPEQFTLDRAKADKGRQLFAALGCATCHQVGGVAVARETRAVPFSQLAAGSAGCLAEQPPKGAAKYDLTAAQRGAIQSALASREVFETELPPRERITRTMAELNCYACHTRDGKGGPTDARLAYFRVAGELDMGDEGRIPPHLTGIGGKLRPEWTHEVLERRGRVRPYMATRMPQFGSANIGSLPGTFEKADARADERHAPELTQRDAKYGRRLAGTGGLSCIACHNVGEHKSLGIPAINFAVMS
jgi:cytochrome c